MVDVFPSDPTPYQFGEKLLEAVNTAASTVATLHVAFMALSAYLAVTVWSTTHLDLLKESPVRLPLIDVQVDLVSFYTVAPWLYCLVHLNLLIQLNLLARKVWALAKADDYPRLVERLHVFPFAHYLLHQTHPWLRPLLAVAVFASVIGVPLLLLLYVQIKFLAYHSEAVTWAQRLAVWTDVALVVWLWPLIASRSGHFLDGFRPEACKIGITAPWLSTLCACGLALVSGGGALVALVPATVPEPSAEAADGAVVLVDAEGFEAMLVRFVDRIGACRLLARESGKAASIPRQQLDRCKDIAAWRGSGVLGPTLWPTAWLFDPPVQELTQAGASAAPLIPRRYLDLHDEVLLQEQPSAETRHALSKDIPGAVNGADNASAERVAPVTERLSDTLRKVVPLKLQQRDLRGARLERAVLPLVDLNRAKLQGASLIEAQLQGASLLGAQLQGASLDWAHLQGARLLGAHLQGASLLGAHLQGARLEDAQLQGARLDWAHLQGARLDVAQLQGASLLGAHLQGASLDGAQLQGASLIEAQLQGASLSGAHLQGASLDRAQLQGADVEYAAIDDALLAGVALNGSQGTLSSAVNSLLIEPDWTPLTTTQVGELSAAVRPYLQDAEYARFEARLQWAMKPDGGRFQAAKEKAGCHGPQRLGCTESEDWLPLLVEWTCAASRSAPVRDSMIDSIAPVFGDAELPPVAGTLSVSALVQALLDAKGQQRCPSFTDKDVERLREVAKRNQSKPQAGSKAP
ncbi:pentapeptide repeat-containing protein [Plasticicumulans acidivorans]|uniref:pentapeptide repeat-containing protein n=1 Tax=Plasticicumulans acidivorans TaxID=886464 RepID=UPI001473B56E|nr:pentapeptide repeat-containing protein [Plasticicumulans acidivorans]